MSLTQMEIQGIVVRIEEIATDRYTTEGIRFHLYHSDASRSEKATATRLLRLLNHEYDVLRSLLDGDIESSDDLRAELGKVRQRVEKLKAKMVESKMAETVERT